MASSAGSATSDASSTRGDKTPAQWLAYLGGAVLVLVGVIGFIADSSFTTGNGIDGDKLLGIFEVNGFHNLVHIASGLLLLSVFRNRTAAKTVALAFGIVYGIVALIGLIDGNDVLGLIPVNPADNILHIALSLAGIIAALVSAREEKLRTSTSPATSGGTRGTTTQRTARGTTTGRDERFDRTLDPRDMNPSDHGEQRTTNR